MQDFVIWWNNNFPLDYWYRRANNIPFGSKEHRELEPFTIIFAWEEEQIQTVVENQKTKKKWKEEYKKNEIDWLKINKNASFYDNVDEDFFKQFDD
tara:strand:- start:1047 stop:1334 length:288 start_codon:yes stop_codon:yes gene_type:complete